MDRETVAKWFEFDYLPRVGAYRKDCKIGCDACIPKHDGDNYCDIDMLSKVLSILKEQEQKTGHWTTKRTLQHDGEWYCDKCEYEPTVFEDTPFCPNCGAKMEGR